MSYNVGDLIIGTITNVKPYALFLNFEDGSDGLLHISEISDSYIRDIEKFGSCGDKLKVKVLSIDSNNGFLRVSLKQVPNEEKFSTHINLKKGNRNIDNGFDILKEKLPEWIENALNKIEKEK